eukprot:TRINITY_DN5330_c3_g1_i1.p1 TRINITY_DN5330_c3_g1~~TRINITY_DN5330_c3_g1_i1.p1  ORF type:complete len:245 (+),score=65.62 TRINITY_DN5330_c3_g1_i1:85-819(+)
MAPWSGFGLESHSRVVAGFATLPCTYVAGGYMAVSLLGKRYYKQHVPRVEVPKWAVVGFDCAVSALNLFVGASLFKCVPWNRDTLFDTKPSGAVAAAFWWYRCCRLVELGDTALMLLKHNFRQVSGLHVYHHTSLLALADCAYSLFPMPLLRLGAMVNSFIHVIMYIYYAASASGAVVPKGVKMGLTALQMTQFAVAVVHQTCGYLRHGVCPYAVAYPLSMLVLFGSFFKASYISRGKEKRKEK